MPTIFKPTTPSTLPVKTFALNSLRLHQHARSSSSIDVELSISKTPGALIKCQYLVSEIYHRKYKIAFSSDEYDLSQGIEPYPDIYVLAKVNGYLVGCFGCYTSKSYSINFGNIEKDIIQSILSAYQLEDEYSLDLIREPTKLVCQSGASSYGIPHLLFRSMYSKQMIENYLTDESGTLPVLLSCGNRSAFRHFYDRQHIRTHFLGRFPEYKVHRHYASKHNPMESRLVIPSIDIPSDIYNMKIPGTYRIESQDDGRFTFEELS